MVDEWWIGEGAEKDSQGFAAHILGRDNEEVIRGISGIGPSDLS